MLFVATVLWDGAILIYNVIFRSPRKKNFEIVRKSTNITVVIINSVCLIQQDIVDRNYQNYQNYQAVRSPSYQPSPFELIPTTNFYPRSCNVNPSVSNLAWPIVLEAVIT